MVEEVSNEALGNIDRRWGRGRFRGAIGIGQRPAGNRLPARLVHRETGDLHPFAIIEELKVVLSQITDCVTVPVAHHHRDLYHRHTRLERLEGWLLGRGAAPRNQSEQQNRTHRHLALTLTLSRTDVAQPL